MSQTSLIDPNIASMYYGVTRAILDTPKSTLTFDSKVKVLARVLIESQKDETSQICDN
jgi:hypothetical protein